MPNDKLAALRQKWKEEFTVSRREKSRWNDAKRTMRNAKNDDDYYYRAFRGHSFQQHFVSLNSATRKRREWRQINIWRYNRLPHHPHRIHSNPLNSFVILIAYTRSHHLVQKYLGSARRHSRHVRSSYEMAFRTWRLPSTHYLCIFGKLF